MTKPLTAAPGIVARIMCAIFDHKYFTSRVFSPISRQVVCSRCGRKWGMHDVTKSLIEWDGELEQLYRTLGQWPGISPEEEQRMFADDEAIKNLTGDITNSLKNGG